MWDEVAGVPLGDDVWGDVVDLATENSRLREEITRLRERVERECGKVASLEEENLRLLRLREMESQEEGSGRLKRARDGQQEEERSGAKRGRGPGGLP